MVGIILVAVQTFSHLSFVLLYFEFWTILVHGSFDDSSHFVHVNINILTNTTSGSPVLISSFSIYYKSG